VGRLAPMAAELVDHLAILVTAFVDLLMFPFDGFWGMMCGHKSCNVFLLLFMVLWVLIFAT
jgi:hypothetical protein